MDAERLDASGNDVALGRLTLRTPGLEGRATLRTARRNSRGVGSADGLPAAMRTALDRQEMRAPFTVEVDDVRRVGVAGGRRRSTRHDKPAFELEAPAPPEGMDQVLLVVHETGLVTWHAPQEAGSGRQRPRLRGASTRTYIVPVNPLDRRATAGRRGVASMVGKKVLKVLVYPVIEQVGGVAAEFFANRWERENRPYRLRLFESDSYKTGDVPNMAEGEWSRLAAGRALLLVHGTFSRAHGGFGKLPQKDVKALHDLYGNRVFAFDHFTLSEDPRRNVDWLIGQIPDGTALDLDIVCHSRGGLVSRVLAERQGELALGSRRIRIGKIVFVAAPNAGTILTDTDYLGDLVDTYTNLLLFLPDNGVTETIETVITAVKHLAAGAVDGLEGLQSMRPKGDFLKGLNAGPKDDKRYFALASNYEPAHAGLKEYARDVLTDAIFDADNDLIVPTSGVFDANGCDFFPIEDRHVFRAEHGIGHSGYFGNPEATGKILGWLGS